MKKEKIKLSRPEKILVTLYELSDGKKKSLRFENIVVALFKQYKEEFHLPGYPKYPDSENVNKAIYSNLKRFGFVNYGNKIFSLTDKGLLFAKELKRKIGNKKFVYSIKLSRFIDNETIRMKKLDGFKFFLSNNTQKILDTDFYNYLGVSVRTEKNEFLGRLKTIEDVINELQTKAIKEPLYSKLVDYHKFLVNKFKDIINYYKQN
jgi:hypothetical protein